ncbi:MAG TPA: barstar [Clostridiales bacterium]|nr:barstar [Clostridiales bacterium]
MRTIIIDGRRCRTKEQAHEYIARKFQAFDYYGKNLDALFDVLTSIGEHIQIKARYFSTVDYRTGILHVLEDAAKVNENITLVKQSSVIDYSKSY